MINDSLFNRKYSGAWFRSKAGTDLLGRISSKFSVNELEADGWYTFSASLDFALVPSDLIEDKKTYNYVFLLRVRNKRNFLLLSTRSDYPKAFIYKCLDANSWDYVNPPTNVSGVVEYLFKERGIANYRLGGMWGKTDGIKPNVKTMNLFGDDVLQTRVFIDYLRDLIHPTRIIIKELNTDKKPTTSKSTLNEVCSVSESSEVSFNCSSIDSLEAVNRFFRLISEDELGFLNLSVSDNTNE